MIMNVSCTSLTPACTRECGHKNISIIARGLILASQHAVISVQGFRRVMNIIILLAGTRNLYAVAMDN